MTVPINLILPIWNPAIHIFSDHYFNEKVNDTSSKCRAKNEGDKDTSTKLNQTEVSIDPLSQNKSMFMKKYVIPKVLVNKINSFTNNITDSDHTNLPITGDKIKVTDINKK